MTAAWTLETTGGVRVMLYALLEQMIWKSIQSETKIKLLSLQKASTLLDTPKYMQHNVIKQTWNKFQLNEGYHIIQSLFRQNR